jgi:Icc-related predicted phosphoesterase
MTKKVIVFGDIHGRDCWKKVIENFNADLYIFLGDYFTSRELISVEDQIKNYEEILKFKAENPDKVIMNIGNHDTEAMKYYWAECYPQFCSTYLREEDNKQFFLDNTQWCHVIDNIVFSHAGISKVWFDDVITKYPEVQTFEDLNKLDPSEIFGFIPAGTYDCYGDSYTQSLTWIRPEALKGCAVESTIYVVGHTRPFSERITVMDKKGIHTLEKEVIESDCIVQCDVLPKQFLMITIENGVKTFEALNIP